MTGKMVCYGTGKTGGHLFPAVSIDEKLKEMGYDSLFLIEGTSTEKEILDKRGLSYKTVDSAPFPFPFTLKRVFDFFFKNTMGLCRAMVQFIFNRPRFVLVTGGYTSFPVGLAALISMIPLFIYEGNTNMGKSNIVLSPFARCSFGPEKSGLGNFVRAGNPVRSKMAQAASPVPGKKNILITGGSQGALVILETLYGMLTRFNDILISQGISFTLATGKKKSEWVNRFSKFKNVEAVAFIHDMEDALANSDIVICRSGAMTVEENLAVGRYAIYIPFAKATGDHQFHNAYKVFQAGAGEVIRENVLAPGLLKERILDIFSHVENVRKAGKKARSLYEARHDKEIISEILRRL